MIWENDPKKREQKEQPTNFYIDENEDIIVGDEILMSDPMIVGSNTPISTYTVTEIIKRRKGALSKKDYVISKTIYSRVPHQNN